MFRARDPDDAPIERQPPRRSWSARIAWLTLVGGGALLALRVSVATVVAVHGNGMAPTLLEGDYVVVLRERWTVERGDVVVYDPAMALGPGVEALAESPPTDSPSAPNAHGHEFPDARRDPRYAYRNTAVVDRDALEQNWEKVQSKSHGLVGPSSSMRLGRVLATPGDTVEFHVDGATLGLRIDGEPLSSKHDPQGDPEDAIAYESGVRRRYAVRMADADAAWPGLDLPPPGNGPVQTRAEGYLIVADNRDEGSCCDSRALGWIPAEAVRGKVVLRLASNPEHRAGDRRHPAIQWNP